MGKLFGGGTSAFFVIIAALVLFGFLFSGPISNFFGGLFGGDDDTQPPDTVEDESKVLFGEPKDAIDLQIDPFIEIIVDPQKFWTGKNRTAKITIFNFTTTDFHEIDIFLTDSLGTELHSIGEVAYLEEQKDARFEFDGKGFLGEYFESGTYYVMASVDLEGKKNVLGKTKIELIFNEGLDREGLRAEHKWKENLEVGLTPEHPIATIHEPIVNPEKFFLENNIEQTNFPAPIDEEIIIGGIADVSRISVKVLDDDGDEYTGQPYIMEIILDYTDYFEKKSLLPATHTFTIDFETPLVPMPPTIRLKVNLNESGSIVYKNDSAELEEYLNDLSWIKGWDLIGISAKDAVEAENFVVTKEQVKEEIKKEFEESEFIHLLIIGSDKEIPMIDGDGFALDSAVYGNVDDDKTAELSVGRLPLEAEQLKNYFEKIISTADYSFFLGKEKVFVKGYKNKSDEENNRVIVRELFQFTGFSPVFGVFGNFEELSVSTNETDLQSKDLIDYFATGCPDFGKLVSSSLISLIVNPRYCPVEIGNNTVEFSATKSANIIGYSKVLVGDEGEEILTIDELLKKVNETNPFENFNLLVSKFEQKTIGESFRDYLNATFLFFEDKTPVPYILFGDPSNTTQGDKYPTNKSFTNFVNDTLVVLMPPIDPNALLARDEPTFTEKEIENIKAGKFFVEKATILEEEFPFVTNFRFSSPNKSRFKYSLELVDSSNTSGEAFLLNEETQEEVDALELNEEIAVNDSSSVLIDYSQADKIVLSVSNLDGSTKSEILEGPVNWPRIDVVPQEDLPDELKRNEPKDYFHQQFTLQHIPQKHSNFLNATGKISFLKKNGSRLSIVGRIENIPQSPKYNPAMKGKFSFDFYRIFLETNDGKQKKISEFTPVSEPAYEFEIFDYEIGNGNYTKVVLYGKNHNDREIIKDTPILSAPMESGAEFENLFGFTQYHKSKVIVDMYYSKELNTKPNLHYEIEYIEVMPLIEGGESEVIFLASDNTEYQTNLVQNAIESFKADDSKKIKIEEIEEQFAPGEGFVAINARPFIILSQYFTEGKHFLSNAFTAMPFEYERGVSSKSVKESFDATDDFEVKMKFENNEVDPFDSFILEEGDNRGITYLFGLKQLFELMNGTIASENGYAIVAGPFAKSFFSEITPEEETPKEELVNVTIEKIDIGAVEWVPGEPIILDNELGKTISVWFHTDAESFESALLFKKLALSSEAELKFIDIENYAPNQSYSIIAPIANLVDPITRKIEIQVAINAPELQSEFSYSNLVTINTISN